MEQLDYRFCGLVEEYRLEIAKKYGIDLQLDVSLAGCTICGIHEIVLISQKFGFIQWLLDNDKIDLEKLDKPEYIDLGDDFMKLSDSDYLTMLLSIQDNPIEFLISVLK